MTEAEGQAWEHADRTGDLEAEREDVAYQEQAFEDENETSSLEAERQDVEGE